MELNDIELFYNQYKNSISTIVKLERRLLRESYSFKKWSVTLREKSRSIRKLYVKNEEMRKKVIGELVENPDKIYPEIADKFLTHIDFFMSEGFRDYGVVVPVLEVLIPYFYEHGPKKRLFDCYYFMATAVLEQREYSKAEEYYNKAIEMYDVHKDNLENYRQFRIMCSYYYRLLAVICNGKINQSKMVRYVEEAIDIWTINVPVDFVTDKKTKGIIDIIRAISAYAVNSVVNQGVAVKSELFEYTKKAFEEQYAIKDSIEEIDSKIYTVYYKVLRARGDISEEKYTELLLEKYEIESERNRCSFDYGEWEFVALFDDELADEVFEAEKIHFMNHSYTYIYYLIPELLKHTKDKYLHTELVNEISRYYSGFPVVSGDYLVDYCIVDNLQKIFCELKDEKVTLKLLENIYVYRQVVTVIHSVMVSRLATLMTEHFIDRAPEIFVGQCGTKSVEDVIDKREEIVDFAQSAGKCHDIGKIMCSDIINLQSRNILDSEFDIIKQHPAKGKDIIDNIYALKEYGDVVLGHHKSFDGKHGYPQEFDNTSSPIKIFIDIISICDSIDAATDVLGRNYAKAKDFYKVLEELKEGSGTRYSDIVVKLISEDNELIKKIHEMTLLEREMTYYEVYRNFIEPDVEFRPKNEKYIRVCSEKDIDKLTEVSDSTNEHIAEYMQLCEGMSYVLVDGYGVAYGYVFAKVGEDDETLDIVEIVVKNEFRRRGYGTLLVEHLEKVAHPEGYRKMSMMAIVEGHYDKFCWRNGFVDCGRGDYMIKLI